MGEYRKLRLCAFEAAQMGAEGGEAGCPLSVANGLVERVQHAALQSADREGYGRLAFTKAEQIP